jgi:hypothetical protein
MAPSYQTPPLAFEARNGELEPAANDARDHCWEIPMKQKRAQELREAWGDAPCEHPLLAKLYDLGAHTGSFACAKCGKVFSFREKAELAASRRGAAR